MHLYRIRNTLNNKEYAGISVGFKCRFRNHRYRLNANKHTNVHLQASWNKYGKEAFLFEIISEFKDLDSLNQSEIDYIAKNNLQNKDFGYNIAAGGKNSITKHTQEAKDKISAAQLKKVVNMCIKTHKVTFFNSVKEVNEHGFASKSIATACKPGRFTHLNHVWMFKDEYDKDPSKLLERALNCQNTKARPDNYRAIIGKNIETGEIIEFINAKMPDDAGFSSTCIRNCLTKKGIAHKGFVWSYKENANELDSKIQRYHGGRSNLKNIYKFDMKGNFIEEIKRDRLNLNNVSDSMLSVCGRSRLYSNGFIYLYKKEEIKERLFAISKTMKSFIKMDLEGKFIEEYNKIGEVISKNPFITSETSIYRVCEGKRKTAYGYKWSYKEVTY